MARASTSSILPPGLFTPGNYIREEDIQTVQEQLNWTYRNIYRMHLFVLSAGSGWGGSGNEVATHDTLLPNATGAIVYYRAQIWVDADAQNLACAASGDAPAGGGITAGNEMTVLFNVGAASDTLTLTDSSGADSTTLATSATGTGLLTVTVTLEHTVGTDDTELRYFYVLEEQPTVPAPPDE